MDRRVKVLVTDDSAFMRKMITQILAQDPSIEVVGQARDGQDAVQKVILLKPDVVTLDVEMPIMDGFEALGRIMQERPTPVVMLSSLTHTGTDATIRCLEAGAVDVIAKPSGSISLDIEKVGREIVAKVKAAALTRPRAAVASAPLRPRRILSNVSRPMSIGSARHTGILLIGSSTGGPRALQTLVPALPSDLGVAVVIVQHMPVGFTQALSRRLNDASEYEVQEASEGDALRPGLALVARGGCHLEFGSDGRARLTEDPPVHNVRPSIDVTLASLVKNFGAQVTGVILTGMGEDGARGMKALKKLGGATFAEDASTCVVYGMPRAAVEVGAVDHVLPLPAIAKGVIESIRARSNVRSAQIV